MFALIMRLVGILIGFLFTIDIHVSTSTRRGENLMFGIIVEGRRWKNFFTGRNTNRRNNNYDMEQDDEDDRSELLDDATLEDWRNDSNDPDRCEIIRDHLSRLG